MTGAGTGLLFSPWLWLVMPLSVFVDALLPIVPGDELVMAAGAVADGDIRYILLVFVTAGIGAFIGDQCAYAVGRARLRRGGDAVLGPRRQKAMDLARAALAKGGMSALIAARFLPGGRTAVNMLAGRLGYPRPQFQAATLVGATISVSYAMAIGTLAGRLVQDSPLFVALGGMALGASVPLIVGVPARVVRVVRRRRGTAESTVEV
ncbi:DedA family protein [Embleya sp. NBC_00896]|uniref:DedA family protein n=1 Tax=Embleya sp. NBC_00896 TaxID=2975961 RepID=UPI0038656057|nr:DedA family protein [Embleya sp. NBC_00896]